MTTFNTQRQVPEVARAEKKLLGILNILGKTRIPELEVGDFYDDLEKNVDEGVFDDKLEAWEEQVGIRLGLRIIDQVMLEQFSKLEDLTITLNDISQEKIRLENENKRLNSELENLKQTSSGQSRLRLKSEANSGELRTLKLENQNLKKKLAGLVGQYDLLAQELRFNNVPKKQTECFETKSPENSLDGKNKVPPSQQEDVSRKRKTPNSSPDNELGVTPKVQRNGSKIFSRKTSPNIAILERTQAHLEDKSFVPDTLQMVKDQDKTKSRTLPVPKNHRSNFRNDTETHVDDMEIVIPETPEKSQLSPSANIEQCITPERPIEKQLARSPLIARGINISSAKKMKIIDRAQPLKEDLFPIKESSKAGQKNGKRNKSNSENHPMVNLDKVKKVGTILPSAQSEIDKKAYHDLDQDFPTEVQRTPKKSHFMVSDTDSDFESPNLLVKSRTRNPKPSNNVKLIPENKKKEIPKKEEKIKNGVKETDDFDLFASPEKTEAVDTKPKKLKKVKSIRSENRWGVEFEKAEELSESDKKIFLANNRQSKLDGFLFGQKQPRRQSKDFVRVNQADTDMERALELSKQVAMEKHKAKMKETALKPDKKDDNDNNDDEDIVDVSSSDEHPPKPMFAHVGPVVRKKEERKKLFGFDCRECQEYYQQKLEEGLTKDQILNILNKCSRHRGLFKPPLTPEKFWDADIIEDGPDDPRNKTQPGKTLRSRATRRAEARSKKAPNLEKEERNKVNS